MMWLNGESGLRSITMFFFFHYITDWILLSQLHNYIKNKLLKDEARSLLLITAASSLSVATVMTDVFSNKLI